MREKRLRKPNVKLKEYICSEEGNYCFNFYNRNIITN